MPESPLRIALLVYRGNPYSGGLGVYVRNLSRELVRIGHSVTVFAGQPYPHLDDGVELVRLPSLDLFREPDPFRVPRPREYRDWIDVAEFALMCAKSFPEPRTFSYRARRALVARLDEFDVVHDDAGLGSALLGIQRAGLPVVATIHHAIEIDRRMHIEAERTRRRRFVWRRWYGFVRMQARVARALPRIITVSDAAAADIVRESGVDPGRIRVVPNGVDTSRFRAHPGVEREPGRIITTASADVPVKGLAFLVEALAKLRTERAVQLVVIGKPKPDGDVHRLIERYGLESAIEFVSGIDDDALVAQYARSQVAVVPSLYEGFSLPAVEAMACGVAVVATTGGALPEVIGDAGVFVPPADAGALAAAIARLLDDAALRDDLARKGHARVLERFTWERAARLTADVYREVVAGGLGPYGSGPNSLDQDGGEKSPPHTPPKTRAWEPKP